MFFCFVSNAFSQEDYINEYTTTSYKNALTYGITLHSSGWGLGLQYLSNHTSNRNYIVNLDILTLKHPKETKVLNPIYDNARPYIFGKMNSIILIRPGLGNQFILADKENPLGVRINLNFVGGVDVTLLKPVFLNLIYLDNMGQEVFKTEKFDPDNPYHNDQSNIKGAAPYFTGFGNLKMTFGLFLKSSLSFEWNEYEERFKVFEIGAMAELFPEPLPVFAYIKNKNLFVNIFANFSFGRRW